MSELFHEPQVVNSSPWTDDELTRAIEAYLDMLRAELNESHTAKPK